MGIEADLKNMALIAQINISEDEWAVLTPKCQHILDYLGDLPKVQVPPATGEPPCMSLRADVPSVSLPKEELMANAAQTASGYFVVPTADGKN